MALFTRFAKQRNAENPNTIRFNESTESKLKEIGRASCRERV